MGFISDSALGRVQSEGVTFSNRISEAKIDLKVEELIKQINAKFNNIGSAD
jgi:hypothetical protein